MFVSAGYIVVAVAIGAVLQAVGAPGSTLCWPSLVATALVAVAFQPVRKQVLRLVDRLVYGNRAAPYEALATLGRRLADRSGRPVGRTAIGTPTTRSGTSAFMIVVVSQGSSNGTLAGGLTLTTEVSLSEADPDRGRGRR